MNLKYVDSILLICIALAAAGCSFEKSNFSQENFSVGDSIEENAPPKSPSEMMAVSALATLPGTLIANENQSFTVASGSVVAYGANSTYIQATKSGTATCSNVTFGQDPVPNVVKACYLVSAAPAPAPSGPPGTLLANENQSFTVASGSIVAYGANSVYIRATKSGTANCSNAAFGQDPVPNVVKACYLVSATPAPAPSGPPGTLLANENQSFTVANGSVIAYGANSVYIQSTFSGTVTCSNGTFGQDPVPNVAKACYLVSAGSAPTPTPAPVPAPGTPGTFLASEGQSFTLTKESVIAFGANSVYTQSTFSGTATCAVSTFGRDPIGGVVKACYLLSIAPAPAPTPGPAPAPGTLPAPTYVTPVPSLGCGKSISTTGMILNVPITAAGRNRSYAIVIPPNYNPNEALPLLFGLHGYGATSVDASEDFGQVPRAGTAERAIYVYPQGENMSGGTGWDLSCGGFDVAFFNAMIDTISNQYCVNTKRIFAYGFSWGADMTNALSCCIGNKLRAVMPLSGTNFQNSTSQCVGPTPAYRAYLGSVDPNYSVASLTNVLGTMSTLSKCSGGAIVESGKGCEGAGYAAGTCSRRSYQSCQQEVSGTTITGMSHDIPDQNLIWNFFSRYK